MFCTLDRARGEGMVLCLSQLLLRQNEVPVAQQVDLAAMPVEDSYDGPRMEGAHPVPEAAYLHVVHFILQRSQVRDVPKRWEW